MYKSILTQFAAGLVGLSIGITHESINQVLDTKGITVGGKYTAPLNPASVKGTADQVTASVLGTEVTLGLPTTGVLVRTPTSAKANNYNISSAESNRAFTNEGAIAQVIFTLPAAEVGLKYIASVQDSDGLRITAPVGATIRIGSLSGTRIESGVPGSSVTLLAINGTTWIAVQALGTWSVD